MHRHLLLLIAAVCLIAGLITLPLPLPTGLPLLALSLLIALKTSHRAKIIYVRLKRRLSHYRHISQFIRRIEQKIRRRKIGD